VGLRNISQNLHCKLQLNSENGVKTKFSNALSNGIVAGPITRLSFHKNSMCYVTVVSFTVDIRLNLLVY